MTFYEFYDFLYPPPGENDFKLEKFLSGTPETFEPFYGNYIHHKWTYSLMNKILI